MRLHVWLVADDVLPADHELLRRHQVRHGPPVRDGGALSERLHDAGRDEPLRHPGGRLDDPGQRRLRRLYCPADDGIAIRTTFGKLRDSVNDPHTCVSEVKYFHYRTGRFLRHKHDWDPAFHKRIAFKHEQEVRVLRHDRADWNKVSTWRRNRRPTPAAR